MFSSGITTDSVLLFVSIHSTNIHIPNQRIKGEEEETFSYPEEKLVMLYSGSNIDPYFSLNFRFEMGLHSYLNFCQRPKR